MDSVKKQHVTKPIIAIVQTLEKTLAIETWINWEYEENVIGVWK